MSLPNIITIFRLLLVPAIVYLLVMGELFLAFVVFVAAGVSDGVDGFIAKRFKSETVLGAYLDPLADKALLVSIYVTLGVLGEMPLWLVVLAVSRDIFIVCAVLLSWMLGNPVLVRPLFVSKANTTGQIILAAVVMADLGFALSLHDIRQLLIYLVGGLTVASAAAYLIEWMRHMSGELAGGPPERPDGSEP